jgi:hypothetical protein
MPDRRTLTQLFGAAALAAALAAPATAGDIYFWRTDDGGYAFADDPKRVPEKYRGRVEIRQSASLADHPRYTPEDDAAQSAYARELEQRLAEMRKLNAELERRVATATAAPAARERVEVRMSSDGEPTIDIPQHGVAGEPVVIEDYIALRDGANRTRTNTVIRRGDEVIAVIRKEQPNLSTMHPRESELERGEFGPYPR